MNSKFLETFVWLATLKSFSLVAERLKTSQPVISSRIAALEKLLGVSLYQRGGTSFELTAAGREILEKSEAIVLMVAEIEALAKKREDLERTVRIGGAEIVLTSWLPDFLRHLDEEFPSMPVDIRTGVWNQLLDDLRTGEIDVAFLVGVVNEPGIKSVPICQFPVKWVGSPRTVETNCEIGALELSKMPVILPARSSFRYEKTMKYFEDHDILTLSRPGKIHTFDGGYSLLTCAHLAMQGLGVTAIPIHPIASLLADGRLAIIPVRQAIQPWHVTACYRLAGQPKLASTIIAAAQLVVAKYAETHDPEFFRSE